MSKLTDTDLAAIHRELGGTVCIVADDGSYCSENHMACEATSDQMQYEFLARLLDEVERLRKGIRAWRYELEVEGRGQEAHERLWALLNE